MCGGRHGSRWEKRTRTHGSLTSSLQRRQEPKSVSWRGGSRGTEFLIMIGMMIGGGLTPLS